MDFINSFTYNLLRELLMTIDLSNISQEIIDRKNNKVFYDFESYLIYHNKPIKKVYYERGQGPNGVFSLAFLDFFDKERQSLDNNFYLAGSSSSSIVSILFNCKKKTNFNNWMKYEKKMHIPNLSISKIGLSIIDYFFYNNFIIDDFKKDEIFVNVLCYDINQKKFKLIFFTNFIDFKDMMECAKASCFIPTISENMKIKKYNNFITFDAGLVDCLFNYNYKIVNINLKENYFLKQLFNYDLFPQSTTKFVKDIWLFFNENKNITYNIKKLHDISVENIKKIKLDS